MNASGDGSWLWEIGWVSQWMFSKEGFKVLNGDHMDFE